MGVVYLALDTRLQREVALKVLPPEALASEEKRRRFIREARAAAGLAHPHIATVHEIDEADGEIFLVSELLRGGSLADSINGGPLPARRAVQLALDIAEGLGHAHGKGFVHRDLKPSNVMLAEDGRAKLIDFGLAKGLLTDSLLDSAASTRSGHLTKPGAIVGTVGYMSPEQARGEPVDPRSDIWSFGVLFFEMLTGSRPFARPSPIETLQAINSAPAPSLPPGAGASAHEGLGRVLGRCLAKARVERYPSVVELLRDLRAAQQRLEGEDGDAPPSWGWVRPMPARRGFVVVLSALAAAAALWYASAHRFTRSLDSVAVLPLANLSADPAQEYFADGVTEALIDELAHIRSLRVVSRTSIMRFKGGKTALPEIARQLGVDAVVEGTLQREGDHVRITARLIEAATERQLKAWSHDGDASSLLRLERVVARQIAAGVGAVVTGAEESRLGGARPVNPAAYDLYLKGRQHEWGHVDELERARDAYRQALDEDPGFAPAWAGLASCWVSEYARSIRAPAGEVMPQAREAVRRALELDPGLAEAHRVMARIELYGEWDWRAADRSIKRALELDAGSAQTHLSYAHHCAIVGRPDEAIAAAARAVELDPLSPVILAQRGVILYRVRRFEEARDRLQANLRADGGTAYDQLFLALNLEALGRRDEALAPMEAFGLRSNLSDLAVAFLGALYAALGRTRDAEAQLAEALDRSRRKWTDPALLALLYMGLGRREQGFACLEKAYQEHSYFVALMRRDDYWDDVRGDPRFTSLVERVGLPE